MSSEALDAKNQALVQLQSKTEEDSAFMSQQLGTLLAEKRELQETVNALARENKYLTEQCTYLTQLQGEGPNVEESPLPPALHYEGSVDFDQMLTPQFQVTKLHDDKDNNNDDDDSPLFTLFPLGLTAQRSGVTDQQVVTPRVTAEPVTSPMA